MAPNIKSLVTVIITTYNRKNYLEQAIKSILSQTYTNFELIIVDNFSDYDFFSFIEIFQDRRIYAYQNANDGIIAVNRNYGIKKARGEYIAFCDDDDYWHKEKLIKQLSLFDNDNIVGVGCNVKKIGVTTKVRKKAKARNTNVLKQEDVFDFCNVALSSLVVKNEKKFFNEDEKFKTVEDYIYQLELTSNNKMIYLLNDELVYYRLHLNGNNLNKETTENILNAINIYREKFEHALYNKVLAKAYLGIGIKSIKNSSKKNYIYFLKSIRMNPYKSLPFLFLLLSFMPMSLRNYLIERFYAFK